MHSITNHSIQAVHLGQEVQVSLDHPGFLDLQGHQVCPDLLFHLAAHRLQAVHLCPAHLCLQDVLTAAIIHAGSQIFECTGANAPSNFHGMGGKSRCMSSMVSSLSRKTNPVIEQLYSQNPQCIIITSLQVLILYKFEINFLIT